MKSKFKIGDKVRLLKSDFAIFEIGEVCEVSAVSDTYIFINRNSVDWCFFNAEVKLVKPLNQVDSIVEEVRKDLKQRSKLGIKKYDTTLDREDLSLLEWHQHHYEELLDAALYTKRIIKDLKSK